VSVPEAVFAFTAPSAGTYLIETTGSSFDTVLAVLDGDSCSADELACNDDAGDETFDSAVRVALVANQRVLVIAEGYGLTPIVGAVRLRISREG
jgi:hypothetical protein